MSSNCDSDGVPVDHDGHRMEDLISHSAPIAIRADIFQEVFSGSGKETGGEHLDGGPLAGVSSSSGGIPLKDDVLIEDYYSSEDDLSPRTAREGCKDSTSATVQAILRTTKHERDELFRARTKLHDVLGFLRSKGFSEEDVVKGFSATEGRFEIPSRCEFGLPTHATKEKKDDPYVDKMKQKATPVNGDDVFVKRPNSDFATAKEDTKADAQNNAPRKSWAEVVTKPSPPPCVTFDYIPPKKGSNIVSPPIDVLQKGNEKFKFSIVGHFSKGTLPFKKVAEFAYKAWSKFKLLNVSQKDEKTFVFRFSDEDGLTSVLSTGTWYIERRPLLVHAWGTSPGKITSMPLWVRFDKVPDAYWTREGLSYLGSAIGKPLTADDMTKKLEILPFAKMCVQYTIGDDLPTRIDVEVLQPDTAEISLHEVLVSYPNKPILCSGCRTLGHLVGACPITVRKWVEKKRSFDTSAQTNSADGKELGKDSSLAYTPLKDKDCVPKQDEDNSWHTVHKKHKTQNSDLSPSADSTPPLNTFKNLTMVDEIEAKQAAAGHLSKSQRKKMRRAANSKGVSSLSTPQ